MNWKTIVIISSIVVYLYLLITEWVDLSPWNDVSVSTFNQKLSGTLVNAVPFALLIAAFLFDLLWLKLVGIGLFVVWLGVPVSRWWVPHFWGASEAHLETYNRFFGQTYKFLPPRSDNPIPDAHYVSMQILVLVNSIISIIALAGSQIQRK